MRINYLPSLLAITLSKLAFGLTLTRLLPGGVWRRLVIGMGVVLIISSIPVLAFPFVQCMPVPLPKNDPAISGCSTKPMLSIYMLTFSSMYVLSM